MSEPTRVLFLCTHNSARSQMAEGLLRHLGGKRYEVESAGTEATHVRPLAIQAMAELGIDISGHESKTLERFLEEPWDYVITVCDQANDACPVFLGGNSACTGLSSTLRRQPGPPTSSSRSTATSETPSESASKTSST